MESFTYPYYSIHEKQLNVTSQRFHY